jgi:hypothetical protein
LGDHPFKFNPGPTLLDFGDQMGTGMSNVAKRRSAFRHPWRKSKFYNAFLELRKKRGLAVSIGGVESLRKELPRRAFFCKTVIIQKGITQKGMTQKGITQKGITQKGITQKGITQKGKTKKGKTQKDF